MKIRGLRWWVISLIVAITIINYLDRNTLSIMWQGIVETLGLIDPEGLTEDEFKTQSKELYAYINMFFMVAYGISQMLSGKLYDKIGTRKGFVASVLVWGISRGKLQSALRHSECVSSLMISTWSLQNWQR